MFSITFSQIFICITSTNFKVPCLSTVNVLLTVLCAIILGKIITGDAMSSESIRFFGSLLLLSIICEVIFGKLRSIETAVFID